MQVIRHKKHAINISPVERIVSGVAGGILTGFGIARRSWGGAGMAATGLLLLRRGATGHCGLMESLGVRGIPKGQGAETTSVPYELGIRVDQSVTIDKPRHEVFAFWRNFSNLPRFMKHLESVRQLGGDRSHWVAKAPAGRTVEWDALIHSVVENERIAWRTLPGADVDHAGSVLFADAPGGRGTEIRVELQYNPPGGTLGALAARFWGEEPSQQIQEDLHRLKQILEVGEVITTQGQPSGAVPAAVRAARRAEEVHIASEASFPASDAPAYNP